MHIYIYIYTHINKQRHITIYIYIYICVFNDSMILKRWRPWRGPEAQRAEPSNIFLTGGMGT